MDGRRIAISKTGLLYCAATIGSFLHVLACTYVCTSAVTLAIPIHKLQTLPREQPRRSRADRRSSRTSRIVDGVTVQPDWRAHTEPWTCRYAAGGTRAA